MNFKKLGLVVAVAASTSLVGCGSSSSGSSGGGTNPSPGTGLPYTCVGDVCTIKGIIDQDLTLTADKTWAIAETVKIGRGNETLTQAEYDALAGYTLTIEAGTKIVGTTGTALIITRGSKIQANGTAAAPIIMSSTDDGYDGRGEWGGLVIQGRAISNDCPDTGVCNIEGEGKSGKYGGTDNADDSGTLRYVVVAEGGAVVGVADELNGIGFMAVGSGTTVDYVQVHNNFDDGVEFWGGTVNVNHLVLTNNQDDSIDWDRGFTGTITNALVIQNTDTDAADNGIESDNNKDSMDALPRSKPTLTNVTLVGNAADNGIKHRLGSAAVLNNVIVNGFKTCLDIDDQASGNLVDTDIVYTNVVFSCASPVKSDNEQAGVDYAQLVIDSQVSSVKTDSVGTLNADYVWSAAGEATGAVTADNLWHKGWTVGF